MDQIKWVCFRVSLLGTKAKTSNAFQVAPDKLNCTASYPCKGTEAKTETSRPNASRKAWCEAFVFKCFASALHAMICAPQALALVGDNETIKGKPLLDPTNI